MKTIEAQNLEEASEFLREWTRKHHKAALFMAVPLILGFLAARIVPSALESIPMAVGSAIGLSMGVCLLPNDFRSRSGSLMPAICLVAAIWIAALVTTVFSLLG
jgi:hypothetical protein